MTIADCLKMTKALADVTDSARLELEVLLAWVLKKDRSYLYTWPQKTLSNDENSAFEQALQRRQNGEPLAYITGEKEFWSLPLYVDRSTLIPRPDTEILVETALKKITSKASILDLGTGTGAIAIALAIERPDCQVIASDNSLDAVSLARRNCERHRIANVTLLHSNFFNLIGDREFNIIVSNPPYIADNDNHHESGDVRFEPKSALVAQDNGLAALDTIIRGAGPFLKSNGWLLLEHGWQQAEAVRTKLQQANFLKVETIQDYGGNDRVSIGQKPFQ